MLSDVKVEEAFLKKGYCNWKNARSTDKGFYTYESSRCHQQAVHRLLAVPKSTHDISLALEKNLSNVQRQNRESLLKVISSVRYLAHQVLPLRGKKDDKESNFQQLLKLRARNDPVFTESLKRKNNKYTSPKIQNEILKELALTILPDVVEAIKAADFFSIMLDESGDVSNKEQAVFCVRWIDENLTPYEDFLGLYEMEKTDADSIVRIIKDSLLRFGFDKEKLRVQCCDGLRTMMRKKTGVSKQIKDDVQPLALSTHCYAHSLNLACGDWMKNCSVVSKSLATSYEITKLVKFSPKRDSHLRKIHKEEYYDDNEYNDMLITVRLFSETRWTVRAGFLSSIYENYKELDQLWTWCLDVYKDTESKARVNGVQSQMQSFDYFFGLRLGTFLLRHSDNLSISLQAEDLCATQAQTIAKNTASTLEKMSTGQNFDLFWTDLNSKAEALNVDEPTRSRRRRPPSRIDDYYGKAAPAFPADVISHYRIIYFESLDCIISAIRYRFDQENYRIHVQLENLLLKAAKGDNFIKEYDAVMETYACDFDKNRFHVQLETLNEYCKEIDQSDVFCLRTVVNVLRRPEVKSHLSEDVKLATLILVLPATNATSERTFSLMKLIKSYLRATIKQSRLNNLMILSSYKCRLDQLDFS